MDQAIRTTIQKIHDCPTQTAVAVTGAGSQALAWLFGVAGASRTVLDVQIPYAPLAFQEFIKGQPQKYVSGKSARLLAGNALQRARRFAASEVPVVGLACTATIATDYIKRGHHRAAVATWSAEKVTTYNLKLAKGLRDRAGEEDVVSRLIIYALVAACGLGAALDLGLVSDDRLDIQTTDLLSYTTDVLHGKMSYFGIYEDGRVRHEGINPQVLLSGSFNPLHDGHAELAEAASEVAGRPAAFELSAINVDKPPLPAAVILDRAAQFAGQYPLYVTGAPTFIGKIRLFPNTIFVIGYDTAERVVAPRYYNNSEAQMMAALRELRELGGRFLVAGRVDDGGVFQEAAGLPLPPEVEDLFEPIPAERFRQDISSSEIRQMNHTALWSMSEGETEEPESKR